jgi:Uma2 family endonuclease
MSVMLRSQLQAQLQAQLQSHLQTQFARPQLKQKNTEIYYPDSDGKPMAESDLHRDIMVALIHRLQHHFAGQMVYVSGNLLLYYEQGNPYRSVAPDCFVVQGVEPHFRRVYKLWEEGQAPQVVFEVSSKSTQKEDLGKKMTLYAQLGVQEYFIYDPTGEYLDPTLLAFQRAGEGFLPMQPLRDEVNLGELQLMPGASESPEYLSEVLGLRLAVDEENRLQVYDVKTGLRLLTGDERSTSANALLAEAEARANEAEAENARLRAELARLQSGQKE